MVQSGASPQGICDAQDTLLSAQEPLCALQEACGGQIPGPIAIPALLEIVRKARRFGMKLARAMQAQDGSDLVTAWVEVLPAPDGTSHIHTSHWQRRPLPAEDIAGPVEREVEIGRAVAELTARLDGSQNVLLAEATARDLKGLAAAMQAGRGLRWTQFVTFENARNADDAHWRLLDGAPLKVEGSSRVWKAGLVPILDAQGTPSSFELLLTSETPLPIAQSRRSGGLHRADARLIGRDVAPVLRQPIARIIANAETIRTRLAGPLDQQYSSYAADIASAGQHLLALIDDLTDLEVVESEEFSTAPDQIDLADVARRAAGILGVRAREQGILVDAPRAGESLPAIAEFRRVLQVLLNLLGNAIRYAPPNSQVWLRLAQDDGMATVIVADQGPGLDEVQQARIFEKFERLGRSGDGGSGLGLYISRRLARAMGGDLTVESAPGQGARFCLSVPLNPEQTKP